MKKKSKLTIIIIFLMIIFGINSIVYGAGRFVDIPVPPTSVEDKDISSEDAQKNPNNNQEDKTNTNNEFVVKSDNNYLKKLEVKGYKLIPDFDSKRNDYTLEIENNAEPTYIDIIAEVEDEKSQIQGNGKIEIKESQEFVNVNVIAENGNLNVYTIKITSSSMNEQVNMVNEMVNEENKTINETENGEIVENKSQFNTTIKFFIIFGFFIILILIVLIIKMSKKNKNGKHIK